MRTASLSHRLCTAITHIILSSSTLAAAHPNLTTTKNSPKRFAYATPNSLGINYTLCTDEGDEKYQAQGQGHHTTPKEKEKPPVGERRAEKEEEDQRPQEVASPCLCLSLSVSACLCLSLPVSACLCLSLPVSACLCLSLLLCLSLPVSACLCLSLPVSACLCLSLPVSACLCLPVCASAQWTRQI
jgi:hypothetical protein